METRTQAAQDFTQIQEQIEDVGRGSRDRDALLSLAIAFLQREVQRHGSEIAALKRLPGTALRANPGDGSQAGSPRRGSGTASKG